MTVGIAFHEMLKSFLLLIETVKPVFSTEPDVVIRIDKHFAVTNVEEVPVIIKQLIALSCSGSCVISDK